MTRRLTDAIIRNGIKSLMADEKNEEREMAVKAMEELLELRKFNRNIMSNLYSLGLIKKTAALLKRQWDGDRK